MIAGLKLLQFYSDRFLNLAYVSLMAVDVHVVITCGGKVAFLCNNLFSPNLMVASAQK